MKTKLKYIIGLLQNRENKLPIRTKSLCCYEGTLKKVFEDKMINTQLQWAYRFLHRYVFSIRRISHTGQALPENKETIKQKICGKINKEKERIKYYR